MAKYWTYLDSKVAGPYELEQIIRLRGFSRETLVCVDDASGNPTHWISPADIPELAHIFKAVDEHRAASPAPAPVRAPPRRPAVRRPAAKPSAPAASPRSSALNRYRWLWLLLAAGLAGAGAIMASQFFSRGALAGEQEAARTQVENAQLPPSSLYRTLHDYMQEKQVHPRWEFERTKDGLDHVTLSWYGREAATVYAFEVNAQAQTVRGLNTAASKLLSEGFPAPASARAKAASAPKKSAAELFPDAIDGRRQALESGDFPTVWTAFSRRKRTEMAKAGMSRDGFIRLQNLTSRVDSGVKQTIVKTKKDSETEMLVLLQQSQARGPDIFIKQLWIFEDDAWRLDDEEKRSAAAPPSETPAAPAPASPVPPTSPPVSKPAPVSLPGMSN